MHEDELPIDDALVARLIASQFPAWAHLPLRRFDSAGTVNAIYRLGEEMAVRLPLRRGQTVPLEKDRRWLPILAPRLPLAVPEPLAEGRPDEGYPSQWAVYRWLPGDPVSEVRLTDPARVADDLAGFVLALQAVDPSGGPVAGAENYHRGAPLAARDASARRGLEALDGIVDTGAARAAWEDALAAPEWDRAPVWLHGDLMPGNLLVHEGRLSAVIDWGALAVGDPACDTIPAWAVLPAEVRGRFRDALGVDDATWRRGRGWALWIALVGLPYYRDTNPRFMAILQRTLDAVLADFRPV